jgi:hypothetical protein
MSPRVTLTIAVVDSLKRLTPTGRLEKQTLFSTSHRAYHGVYAPEHIELVVKIQFQVLMRVIALQGGLLEVSLPPVSTD